MRAPIQPRGHVSQHPTCKRPPNVRRLAATYYCSARRNGASSLLAVPVGRPLIALANLQPTRLSACLCCARNPVQTRHSIYYTYL